MPPSSLVPDSLYLGPCSNYAQSRGLNRKQPGLVCASAVIKRGAKKGINDLIEEERKGGNHTDSGSGGESMNGAPGTLLEQGIVGLLKCVKILVVLQSRWRLVVRIPSILLFVNPERLLLFLPIALLQKFMIFDQIRKDAVSEVLVCQAWHIAIHSSLMWQGPPTAKPPLLLHRLLITVDKHTGGEAPTPLFSIHTL
ncbi:hypothetical protein Q8A73_018476 [Channa argus]|nr:hypothetical protein Q8A73_018476 [Channa argus]